MKDYEAHFYEVLDGSRVRCNLCPHFCTIDNDRSGTCGARNNKGSRLISDIYGRLTALAMDPIEKKPLYHFYPGTQILSIGTKGCNLKCPYCQNWHISQELSARSSYYSPEDIVSLALKEQSLGIAYTYSEPIIWYEYVMDTARQARKNNLQNVMVTNGFINSDPLKELLNYIDAMNIDLKSFREETYKKVQKAKLSSVVETIKAVHESDCHLEITTLVVTDINDDLKEMSDIIDFIASLDKKIPWHISRYYPNYRYDKRATDIGFLKRVYEEATKKLDFVYCGNVPSSHIGSDTVCPSCQSTIIKRSGYFITIENLKNARCSQCGADLGMVQ